MLEATNLGQRYGRGPWLFRGLDLQVRPGEITSVLGPNARVLWPTRLSRLSSWDAPGN